MTVNRDCDSRMRLVHNENHCFAEIFQVFPPNKNPIPLSVGINSYMDDGWSLSSGIRKVMAVSYMMRLPRALWISQPGATVAELMKVHLERRHQITSDLGIRVLIDSSPTTYFDFVGKRNAERRASMKNKNFALSLASALGFRLRPKQEWMGDYPKQVAFRREPWRSPARA